MKKIIIFFIILILSLSVFADKLDQYIFLFSYDKLVNSKDKGLNVLGLLLKYHESNYEEYKSTANIYRSNLYNYFSPDDSTALNILTEINPYEYLKPKKLFTDSLKNYPDSVILNALFIEFAFKDWESSGDPSIVQNIFASCDTIESKKGQNPLTVYYRARILWESKLFGDRTKAYNDLYEIYQKNRDSMKITELLIRFTYQQNKTDIMNSLYETYSLLPDQDDETLIIFAKAFLKSDNEKSRMILENIVKISERKNILASAYEMLGDLSDTTAQKINFYKLSLEKDPDNPEIQAKLGLEYYRQSPKENLTISRVFLNQALSAGSQNPEAEKLLKIIQNKVKLRGFLLLVLPIIIFVALGVTLIIIYEKNKYSKEQQLMKKNDDNWVNNIKDIKDDDDENNKEK